MEEGMQNIKYTDSASFRCLEHLRETSLDLYLVHCGKEQCIPAHLCNDIRTEYIIHFVISGKGTFSTGGGAVHELTAGQMFLITPGEPNTYRSDEEDPWYYAWIGFNGIRVETILQNCGFSPRRPVRNFSDSALILKYVDDILDARRLTLSNDMKRKSYLMMLLADLMDDTATQNTLKKTSPHYDYATNVYLESAIDFIKRGYQQGIKVADVTDYVGISRTYLNQVFQKELGLPVQTFLIDYRLHKAANMLLSTPLAVSQVSDNVGYSDALAFSKAFKKKFGVSPKNYRTHVDTVDKFNEKQPPPKA